MHQSEVSHLFQQIQAQDKFSSRHATIQKVSKYEDFSNEIEFQSLVEAASRLDYLPVDSRNMLYLFWPISRNSAT